MPDLVTLGVDQDPNIQFTADSSNTQVEPLDGPTAIDVLMDRFPDTVYTQGRDTHLYQFISAMCGDAGAGILKNQAYISRLRNEGELLTFSDLDTLYAQTFRFPRLASEIYEFDPSVDILTQDQWAELAAQDEHYKQRVLEFFNGARLGNSPDGISLIAQSGSGVPVDVVENYKAIFDTLSDDPLGMALQGTTFSPSEFIIIPRIINNGVIDTADAYDAAIDRTIDPTTGVETWATSGDHYHLLPDIERNMVNILDQLRPVGALMSLKSMAVTYQEITPHAIDSSSNRVHLVRFVTGNQNVTWPSTDNNGNFIESNVENEAPTFALSARELPVIYLTVENLHAYTEAALNDPAYNTSNFYLVTNGVSPYMQYDSEHVGKFYREITSIFPFMKNVPDSQDWSVVDAIAAQNTPLTLIGRSK